MHDEGAYYLLQILDALTCPLNRHATREERKCPDDELIRNPGWLVEHYEKYGGAAEWGTRHKDNFENGDEFTKKIYAYFHEFSSQKIFAIILDKNDRHRARVKHSCNDDELYFHPEWLLEAFMERHVPVEACLEDVGDIVG